MVRITARVMVRVRFTGKARVRIRISGIDYLEHTLPDSVVEKFHVVLFFVQVLLQLSNPCFQPTLLIRQQIPESHRNETSQVWPE